MRALVRGHLSNGNTFRLRVLGGSMLPLIQSGDILRINAAQDYSVGDILLYTRGDDWFAHRLAGIRKQGDATRLVMRGDALPEPDPPVGVDSVLGRVEGIEREGLHLRLDGFRAGVCRALARARFPWHHLLPAVCGLYGCLKAGRARLTRQS